MKPSPSATSQQISQLETILVKNGLYGGEYDRLWAILEAHRVDQRVPGDGTPMSYRVAADTLTWLGRVIRRGTVRYWETHPKQQS